MAIAESRDTAPSADIDQRKPPAGPRGTRGGVADALWTLAGRPDSVALQAWDGSAAGVDGAPLLLRLRSIRALRHMVSAPGQLGLSRAYVDGDIDLDGDPYEALKVVAQFHASGGWAERAAALRDLLAAAGPGMLRPLPAPAQEVRGRWRRGIRHSKSRDAAAIAHHYDVGNRFYELVLGPTMAYTCAVFPRADATLEEAQTEKFDLVCRKLGLRPGMRLLDVGCGWGGLVMHAAREYGVRALGVTLSKAQAEWGAQRIGVLGLGGRAEVRHADYRDVTETGFDAIASIGLTEHIGERQLDGYVARLRDRLRPEGRLLNHCITRPRGGQRRFARRGFITRYVFPDGELLAPSRIVGALHDGGLEVRHEENLREHYALTLKAWCDNLAANRAQAVAEAGEGSARVWHLYMAGSRLGFEQDEVELHQVLAVRTSGGRSGMPLRPDW
ncbi:MAG: class I SAM-dependent methyltransferase [Frankiaceae bacterium]